MIIYTFQTWLEKAILWSYRGKEVGNYREIKGWTWCIKKWHKIKEPARDLKLKKVDETEQFFRNKLKTISKWKNPRVFAKLKYAQKCGIYPAGIYLFKVNNKNTRTRCEIHSKLTIKTC